MTIDSSKVATLAAALAVAALLSCTSSQQTSGTTVSSVQPDQEATPNASPEPPKAGGAALLESWHAAMTARDYDKLASLYAEDATAIPASSGMVITGGTNIAQKFHKAFPDAFPDVVAENFLILQNGNTAAAVGKMRGTHTKNMMGLAPTNKKTSFYGLQIIEVNGDGKIAREILYADNLNFMAQIGMHKGPHRPYDDSAAPAPVKATSQNSQAEAANVAAVRQALEHFNSHDVQAMAALYTADAVVRNQSAPVDIKGREAIVATTEMYFGWFSDLRAEVQSVWGAGDYVVATYVLTGTNDGDMDAMGQKATNKKVRLESGDVYRMVDGKIAEHWVFVDGMSSMIQLGLMKLGQ